MSDYLKFIILMVLSSGFVLGCSKKSVLGTNDSSSSGDVGNPPPTNNYLWMHHTAVKGALRYTHKSVASGSWPDQCKVDLDAIDPADRDILCYTESTELDLMHLGLELQYNVPMHAKCPYVITMTPFFFQFEPPKPSTLQIEPAIVEITEDTSAGKADYIVEGFYADGVTPNPHIHVGEGGPVCNFNYEDSEGPNCCEGNYVEYLTTITDAGTEKNPPVTKDWGGKRAKCLSGPAMALNPSVGVDLWPDLRIWRMTEQLDQAELSALSRGFVSPLQLMGDLRVRLAEDNKDNKPTINFGTFPITSLLDQNFASTRYLATYHEGTSPSAFQDILDYYDPSGFYLQNGDPRYYTILCSDYAREIYARIRLQVREWNTYGELSKATEPTADEDNESGPETDFPEYDKGDYRDWEDSSDYPGHSL